MHYYIGHDHAPIRRGDNYYVFACEDYLSLGSKMLYLSKGTNNFLPWHRDYKGFKTLREAIAHLKKIVSNLKKDVSSHRKEWHVAVYTD